MQSDIYIHIVLYLNAISSPHKCTASGTPWIFMKHLFIFSFAALGCSEHELLLNALEGDCIWGSTDAHRDIWKANRGLGGPGENEQVQLSNWNTGAISKLIVTCHYNIIFFLLKVLFIFSNVCYINQGKTRSTWGWREYFGLLRTHE